ncbi:NUDIX domain-containing protein [Vagococcus entomophilus]|uniref:Nudix hydrolase domain-containing protein n=1 Tax=Vagococcus entomophilus TaxID=1160095 RepID=A0A430AJJ6_9ENTE|nr:NUDIX domain-containing protein [Vagococcus entomophilus]RSU08219.1 hypothetical protein CBF30_02960 [Vagococcus entomophilus]
MKRNFKNKQEERLYYEQCASEEEFLDWYHQQETKQYARPSVTIDNVILSWDHAEAKLKLLLIRRKAHPFKGYYAFTGGFVEENEEADETVKREVKEEVNLAINEKQFEQLHTFTTPYRDPRTWVITIAYITYLRGVPKAVAGDDAAFAEWVTLECVQEGIYRLHSFDQKNELLFNLNGEKLSGNMDLAYDHLAILVKAINQILSSINTQPHILKLLPETFTLKEAVQLLKEMLGENTYLDNSNFKRTHGKYLVACGEESGSSVGRPSKLYKLKEK